MATLSGEEVILYTAFLGAVTGVLTLMIRAILKSNCLTVDCCWGMIRYTRADEDNINALEISPVGAKV